VVPFQEKTRGRFVLGGGVILVDTITLPVAQRPIIIVNPGAPRAVNTVIVGIVLVQVEAIEQFPPQLLVVLAVHKPSTLQWWHDPEVELSVIEDALCDAQPSVQVKGVPGHLLPIELREKVGAMGLARDVDH
jgi:hypothetical protein